MARKKIAAGKEKKFGAAASPIRNVVPDRLDLRDRVYMPPVAVVPGLTFAPKTQIPVLNQKQTNACTGFALASVVYQLQHSAKRKQLDCYVSPFMLYSMARRYDEFPGDPGVDTGSSLRGAMKGWYKHGACSDRLWTTEKMPTDQTPKSSDDWWLDAVQRPLGAYYRVDTRSVTDMHVALNEIGILYASAVCHSGWDEGSSNRSRVKGGYWMIPRRKAGPSDGGHAFAIVGYNQDGFIVHNSWGTGWGTKGQAVLTYEDWLDHAMDCWVAQLGVLTELHLTIAQSTSLRLKAGKVQLASESSLRNREIGPFIINMENNGRLSNTGDFRTQESDIEALVTHHLGMARTAWGLGKNDSVDIAIYAHGGLTSEDTAGVTAAKWIPALYEHQIFPIFLMWETDLWSTLKGRLEDVLAGQPRPTGGFFDGAKSWWNERLEKLLATPGTAIWSEMKQNADVISNTAESGGMKLYRACQQSPYFSNLSKVRLHLVGHSAGAILHSHVVDRLGGQDWTFESVNFMAPAVRVDLFEKTVVPAIKSGKVKRFNQFHLSDDMEQKDPTCKPILGYSRSLLYLVSQSLEQGRSTPILGMEKYFNDHIGSKKLPNVYTWAAPGKESHSTTHGGFDDDQVTMASVIALMKGNRSKR
jgi:hypothetical protein